MIRHPGDRLQFLDRAFRVRHALGRLVHLAGEQVRVLAVHHHLRERLDLALDPVELDHHVLGVLVGLAIVVEPEMGQGDAVLERGDQAFVALGFGRFELLVELVDPVGQLTVGRTPEKSAERLLRDQQPEKIQSSRSSEPRRRSSPPPIGESPFPPAAPVASCCISMQRSRILWNRILASWGARRAPR
ncbi:MAG: hypothetical protein R2882_06060 [Gemmatimonadales bacterium]